MLTRPSLRLPLFLRLFVTAVSAFAVVCVASAFTFASAPLASPSASSPAQLTTNTETPANVWLALHAAHLAHLHHLTHLARLALIAQAAQQAAAAAALPVVTVSAPQAPHTAAPAVTSQTDTTVSPAPDGSVQSCIIARESGGDSQVFNASGHYGLYQFSYSTWVAHGGSAADFGHASVAEQNQVFANTVAADGYSDWAPYDGC